MNTNTLTPDLLQKMNAYWRAANYLSVGQIYLYDNPLLKRPLKLSDVKPLVVRKRLLRHLNRDLAVLFPASINQNSGICPPPVSVNDSKFPIQVGVWFYEQRFEDPFIRFDLPLEFVVLLWS